MEPTKIIVRYTDGRILKGTTQNFFPDKPSFHFQPLEAKTPAEKVEVRFTDLKALFFVRDFAGDPRYQEKKNFPEGAKISGRKVEVTFKDGEVMVGSTLGYDAKRTGFFFFPSDPAWNLIRAFVVTQAVRQVRNL